MPCAETASSFIDRYIHLKGEDLYREDVNKISFTLSSYQDHLDSKVEFAGLEANTWGGKGEMALFGDLGPTGITKKHAIEVLLKHLNADVKDTISFGDAKIDLSMFDEVARISRFFTSISFVVALILISRKMVGAE